MRAGLAAGILLGCEGFLGGVEFRKVARKDPQRERGHSHGMDEFPRTPENDSSQSTKLSEREERRSQNRKEGVISRIEDITYKVLRKHEPQP